MNDLQTALLTLGLVLVIAVFAHGKWLEYRQRKLATKMLSGANADPLMQGKRPKNRLASLFGLGDSKGDGRQEPTLGAGYGVPVDASGLSASEALLRGSQAGSFKSSGSGQVVRRPLPDNAGEPEVSLVAPEADFIAAFTLLEPVRGEVLESVPPETLAVLAALKKRVAWVGFDESGMMGGRWEIVRPEGQYRLLRIGLQLADRSGPLSSSLLESFRRAMEKIGDALTAVPEIPNPRDAVAKAVRLDRVCAEVDIQISVHIAPRHDHYAPETVRDAAAGIAFRAEADGSMSYPDAGGQRLFSLLMPAARTADGLPAPTVVLLLDVPCVSHGEPAFDRMMTIAQELADVLDGLVVDEHRRPITERFVAPVRQQIAQVQSRMMVQGVPAGSPLALRLFS